MKQSRSTSLLKSVISTATGFGISIAIQYGVCWWYSLPLRVGDNLLIIGIFTAASLVRGYLLERFFELMGWRVKMSPGVQAVIFERQRQKDGEGWDDTHDDRHATGELAHAGAAYLIHAGTQSATTPHEWPWNGDWWKPNGYRRDLVRGIALGIAELDKFDRDRKRGRGR